MAYPILTSYARESDILLFKDWNCYISSWKIWGQIIERHEFGWTCDVLGRANVQEQGTSIEKACLNEHKQCLGKCVCSSKHTDAQASKISQVIENVGEACCLNE